MKSLISLTNLNFTAAQINAFIPVLDCAHRNTGGATRPPSGISQTLMHRELNNAHHPFNIFAYIKEEKGAPKGVFRAFSLFRSPAVVPFYRFLFPEEYQRHF